MPQSTTERRDAQLGAVAPVIALVLIVFLAILVVGVYFSRPLS